MEHQLISIALFILQTAYSFLSTRRVNAAIGDSTISYVSYGFMSDSVKYLITAGLAVQSMNNNWLAIAITVFGGVLGNTIGHLTKKD